MNPEVVETDWREIEGRPPAFGRLSARRTPYTATLLLAVDHEGFRHALLPLPKPGGGFRDSMSRGLAVQERALVVESEAEQPFLDVACTDHAGRHTFNLVVSDIIRQLHAGADSVAAVRSTMARWRRFWGAAPVEGLSPEQVRGLFGELWFLLKWALPYGFENVTHWDGPTGARHDFHWPTLAIETKTTNSMRGHIHRINGLDQLDPPDSGLLYVFSLRVRDEAGAANSLVVVIERITELLTAAPDLLDLFEIRLGQAGYSPIHSSYYADMRFHVADQRLYLVADGFPKLSSQSFVGGLPLGVERVEYDINLEACAALCAGRDPGAPGINLTP